VSYTIDLNILLYATDASSPFHESASNFLAERARDPEVLCLAWPTVMGYLRVATHPRIFASPLSPEQAMANIGELIALSQCQMINETNDVMDVYRQVTMDMSVRGNLVPDAHVVALMRLHDVRTIFTNDVDFRRFSFIEVRNPLSGG
jgi:toxin-antitoxin system PIN domain toxin